MYISKYTDFQAFEPPYTDKIYYKEGNKTLCIIHIDNAWNMWGEVLDPFNIPIDVLRPKYDNLNQIQCEQLIMRHMPPRHRLDVKRKYNMENIDYAILMYKTRLITLIDNYWAAWSENDKAEDYHPKYNQSLMEQRFEGCIQLDPEPEDEIPSLGCLGYNDIVKRFGTSADPGEFFINPEFNDMKFEEMTDGIYKNPRFENGRYIDEEE